MDRRNEPDAETTLNQARHRFLLVLASRAHARGLPPRAPEPSLLNDRSAVRAGEVGRVAVVLDMRQLDVDARKYRSVPDLGAIVRTIAAGRDLEGVACFHEYPSDDDLWVIEDVGLRVRAAARRGHLALKFLLDDLLLREGRRLITNCVADEICVVGSDELIGQLVKEGRRVVRQVAVARFDWRPVNGLLDMGVRFVRLGRNHLDRAESPVGGIGRS